MMRSKDRLRQCAAILGLLYILLLDPAIVMSAPLTVNDMHFDGGCYYNLELYKHGEQIRTNEPCLNCTCTNRMLMCYLNTCPYSKPIGSDCEVERLDGQCCPSIKCPEVPVLIPDVLPFVSVGKPPTTSEPPLVTAAVTQHSLLVPNSEQGCFIEGVLYPEGHLVPSANPCELCYCIRNHSACVIQNCTLQIPGCSPNYKDGRCCPISYDCDTDVHIIPTTTTTALPHTGCFVDNVFHYDGSIINTGGHCDHCYCMKGEIICAVRECRAPEMDGCTAILGEDHCCPFRYDCPRTESPIIEVHTEKVNVDYLSSSVLDAEDREKVPSSSSGGDGHYVATSPPMNKIPFVTSSTLKDSSHYTDMTTEVPKVIHQESDLQTTESTVGVSVELLDLPKNVSHEVDVDVSTSLPDEVEVTTERIPEHHLDVDSTTENIVSDSEIGSSTSVGEDEGAGDVSTMSVKDESISLGDSTQHAVELDVSEKYDTVTKGPVMNDTIVALPSVTIAADVVEPIEVTASSISVEPSTSAVAVPEETDDVASSAAPPTSLVEDVHQEPTSTLASDIEEEKTVSSQLVDMTIKPIIVDDSSSSSVSESLAVTEEVPQREEATGSPVYDNVIVTEGSTDLPKDDASEDVATTSVPIVVIPVNKTSQDEQIGTTQLSIDKIDTDESYIEKQSPVASSTSSYAENEADVDATSKKPSSDDNEDQPPSDSSLIEVFPSEIPLVSSTPTDSLDISTSEIYNDVEDRMTTPKSSPSDLPSQNSSDSVVTVDYVEAQDIAQNRTETTEGIVVPSVPFATTMPPSEETTHHAEVVTDAIVGSVPGEGDCNQDGITYKNGNLVVSNDICRTNCTCKNSIIKCEKVACPIPDIVRNMTCRELFEDGRCCPRFICEHTVVGEGVFSSDNMVTLVPSVAPDDVDVIHEITTKASDEESVTSNHPYVPSNEGVSSVVDDSSEEPRTVPPPDTTSIHVDEAPVEASTSSSGVEVESKTEPQPSKDIVTTEKEESVSEAAASDSVMPSSEPSVAIDDVQHVTDSIYKTTEQVGEAGVEQTTASATSDLDPVLPSEAKNDSYEDIMSNDLTTIGQLDPVSEKEHTTALPESYDESKIVSSTSSSGQDVADTTGPVKDDNILDVTVSVKEELASTASAEVVTDSIQTEQPPSKTDSPVVTSELPLDEAAVETTPSLVDDDDQDILTTSASSKGPVSEFDETTMKVEVPESTEAPRDPEIISSTVAAPVDSVPPEIKRNMTIDLPAVDELPSREQSPNVTDIPQKDETVVPEVGYTNDDVQTPSKSDIVSTTLSQSQEEEITTSLPIIDDVDIISNTIDAGSIDDATSKLPSIEDLITTSRPHVSEEPEILPEEHSESAADSLPHLVSSTSEIYAVDSTASVKDDVDVAAATKGPLDGVDVESTEGVVSDYSTLKPSEEPLSEDASLKPDSESVTQQTHVELDVSLMKTTEKVADATEKPITDSQFDITEKPLEDSVTTEEHREVHVATKVPLDDSAATKESLDDSAATKESLDVSAATNEPVDDSAATKESLDDSAATKESLDVSAATNEPVDVSAATKKPLDVSAATKEPLDVSAATKEPLDVSAATKEPLDDSAATKEPLDDSAATKEPLDDSAVTKQSLDDSAATKESLDDSAATKESLDDSAATKESLDDSAATKEPLDDSAATKEPLDDSAATKEPLDDSAATKEPLDDSAATKESLDDSAATNEPLGVSAATKEPLDDYTATKDSLVDSIATKEPSKDSETTNEPSKDSETTKEPSKDFEATKDPLDDSVTTEEPHDDSLSTKKPLIESITTKEPQKDEIITEEPYKDSVDTKEPVDDSVTTEEPLEHSVSTEEPHEESVETKEPPKDSIATKQPLEVTGITEEHLKDSVTAKPSTAAQITDSPSIVGDVITTEVQVAAERTDYPPAVDDAFEITTVAASEKEDISGASSPVLVSVTEKHHHSTDKLSTSPPSSSTILSSTIVDVKLPDVSVTEYQNVSTSTDKVVSQPLHTISSITDITTSTQSSVHVTVTSDLLPYPTEDYDDRLDQVNPDAGILITSENFTLKEGDCVYESRIYSSAQQIPRKDPCDFCFCFRGDIICLQQSCPPPIEGCYEEAIPGFCCPRYECPITAVTLNVTNPKAPPYPVTASRYRTVRALTQVQVVVCEFRKKFYNRGELISSASGPCMDCMCGEKGTMKCTPKTCQLDPLWQTLPNLRKFNKLDSTRVGRNRF